jgi:hypothetical protein
MSRCWLRYAVQAYHRPAMSPVASADCCGSVGVVGEIASRVAPVEGGTLCSAVLSGHRTRLQTDETMTAASSRDSRENDR